MDSKLHEDAIAALIVPEYGPRKPMPENCRKALERAHAVLNDYKRSAP